MKVTIVPIVIGALGTIIKGLLKGLEDLEVGGRVETIQTTALPRMARILRRVLETADTDEKNSRGVNDNNNNNNNVIRRNCGTNCGRVTNCGTAGSRNCRVTWHQLWSSTIVVL